MPDADEGLTRKEAQRLAECFAGLSHPERVRLLAHLVDTAGELSILDLAQHIVVKTSEVGYHLRKLQAAGLVERRSSGGRLFYRLSGPWVAQLIGAAVSGLLPARGVRP